MNILFRKLTPAGLLTLGLAATASLALADTPAPTAPQAPAAAPAWHRGGGLRALRIRREIAAQIGLTDNQKALLKAARQSAGQQLRALRDDPSLTPEDRKTRAQAIRAGARQQMQQILTPEQLQQLKALR